MRLAAQWRRPGRCRRGGRGSGDIGRTRAKPRSPPAVSPGCWSCRSRAVRWRNHGEGRHARSAAHPRPGLGAPSRRRRWKSPGLAARATGCAWSGHFQKGCSHLLGSAETRFRLIGGHRDVWPVWIRCDALRVSASGFRAWRSRPESPRKIANRELPSDIRRVHADYRDRYGAPRIYTERRVEGWLYLAVIFDLFTRKVVGWAIPEIRITRCPFFQRKVKSAGRSRRTPASD
jgi:hypothetical protein